MIRTDKEYNDAKTMFEQQKKGLADQRKRLESMKLSPEQVKMGMDPVMTLHAELGEEIAWYERVKKGDFKPATDIAQIGRTLIALRIARGWSQRDLAAKLEITESQMSRDERNEYHGISAERIRKIIAALGANLKLDVSLQKQAA